jgi:cyanophycinase
MEKRMELYRNANKVNRGILMPIGGAEDRKANRLILRRFIELAGGSDARIVVIPTASNLADTAALYTHIFNDLGAHDIRIADPSGRQQANDADFLSVFEGATGIFITGGDQVKLMTIIGGTGMSRAIHQCYRAGAVIAGTSAGASAISEHMIAFGRSGAAPSQRMVQMGTGLGLAPHMVIDQHFSQRDRMGRLTTAVLYCPDRIGIGVDEDTALILRGDHTAEVIGAGSVTILDMSRLEYTDVHSAKRHNPISVRGARTHTLRAGDEFDFNTLDIIEQDEAVAV